MSISFPRIQPKYTAKNILTAKKSDSYVKTGLNWFVVDCDLDHSVFAFRIADIGGQNSDEIEACASLGTIQTIV